MLKNKKHFAIYLMRIKPKDYEVWGIIHKHYCELKFSPMVEIELKHTGDDSKHMQRNDRKQQQNFGIAIYLHVNTA